MGSCNAIYVQRRRAGVYWVWPGPTQVDHEPDPKARNFIGEFIDRGAALCAAHDADHGTSDGVVELQDVPEPLPLTERLAREAGIAVHQDGSMYMPGAQSDQRAVVCRLAALVARECARMADSSGMQMAILEKFKA